ncbi:hypothetical protein JKP88DRAFT_316945 [Tribonema minus]|uniref:Uncharacterized protein n=1 Tax=Tribonema minus TaxID=303371 RepID=A0A836CF66_9STRA|nr:hypothetical protein JKP88DRAFT_316945 [Tribonema minus]
MPPELLPGQSSPLPLPQQQQLQLLQIGASTMMLTMLQLLLQQMQLVENLQQLQEHLNWAEWFLKHHGTTQAAAGLKDLTPQRDVTPKRVQQEQRRLYHACWNIILEQDTEEANIICLTRGSYNSHAPCRVCLVTAVDAASCCEYDRAKMPPRQARKHANFVRSTGSVRRAKGGRRAPAPAAGPAQDGRVQGEATDAAAAPPRGGAGAEGGGGGAKRAAAGTETGGSGAPCVKRARHGALAPPRGGASAEGGGRGADRALEAAAQGADAGSSGAPRAKRRRDSAAAPLRGSGGGGGVDRALEAAAQGAEAGGSGAPRAKRARHGAAAPPRSGASAEGGVDRALEAAAQGAEAGGSGAPRAKRARHGAAAPLRSGASAEGGVDRALEAAAQGAEAGGSGAPRAKRARHGAAAPPRSGASAEGGADRALEAAAQGAEAGGSGAPRAKRARHGAAAPPRGGGGRAGVDRALEAAAQGAEAGGSGAAAAATGGLSPEDWLTAALRSRRDVTAAAMGAGVHLQENAFWSARTLLPEDDCNLPTGPYGPVLLAIQRCMYNSLCMWGWLRRPGWSEQDVITFITKVVPHFMRSYKIAFAEVRGAGTAIPKWHLFVHIAYFVTWYGPPLIHNGGWWEQAHIM